MAKSKGNPDDDHKSVAALADRLGLTGKDRERYIHQHMTGFGYKSKRTYVASDDDDDDSGGFFGKKRNDDDDDDDF